MLPNQSTKAQKSGLPTAELTATPVRPHSEIVHRLAAFLLTCSTYPFGNCTSHQHLLTNIYYLLGNLLQRLYEHPSLQPEKQPEKHPFTRQIDTLSPHESPTHPTPTYSTCSTTSSNCTSISPLQPEIPDENIRVCTPNRRVLSSFVQETPQFFRFQPLHRIRLLLPPNSTARKRWLKRWNLALIEREIKPHQPHQQPHQTHQPHQKQQQNSRFLGLSHPQNGREIHLL